MKNKILIGIVLVGLSWLGNDVIASEKPIEFHRAWELQSVYGPNTDENVLVGEPDRLEAEAGNADKPSSLTFDSFIIKKFAPIEPPFTTSNRLIITLTNEDGGEYYVNSRYTFDELKTKGLLQPNSTIFATIDPMTYGNKDFQVLRALIKSPQQGNLPAHEVPKQHQPAPQLPKLSTDDEDKMERADIEEPLDVSEVWKVVNIFPSGFDEGKIVVLQNLYQNGERQVKEGTNVAVKKGHNLFQQEYMYLFQPGYQSTFQLFGDANQDTLQSSVPGIKIRASQGKIKPNDIVATSQLLTSLDPGTIILAARRTKDPVSGKITVDVERLTLIREDVVPSQPAKSKRTSYFSNIMPKLAAFLSVSAFAAIAYNFDTVSEYFSNFMSKWFSTYFGQK